MGKVIFLRLLSLLSLTASSQLLVNPRRLSSGHCPTNQLQLLDQSSCSLQEQLQLSNASLHDSWIHSSACTGEYCVYSFPDYAAGRGIVLLSTQQHAESIARYSIPTEYLASQKVNIESNPPYYVTEVPGKGLGVIANQTIRRGTRIMAWTPALVVHEDFLDKVDENERFNLLDQAVDGLPLSLKSTFMEQLGHFGGHHVNDIVHTNSFNTALGPDSDQHMTSFPEVSRFNHDCRPNVVFYIDNLVHFTFAARDIQPGEELTISYLDEFRARKVRTDRTRRSWGFVCTCPQCSLSDDRADESDKRLSRIWEMEEDLVNVNSGLPILPNWIEKLLRLYKEERLEHRMADAYTLAALNYNSLGDEKRAAEYAALSVDANMIENGPKTQDLPIMRALAADPKGHWSWRKRLRTKS